MKIVLITTAHNPGFLARNFLTSLSPLSLPAPRRCILLPSFTAPCIVGQPAYFRQTLLGLFLKTFESVSLLAKLSLSLSLSLLRGRYIATLLRAVIQRNQLSRRDVRRDERKRKEKGRRERGRGEERGNFFSKISKGGKKSIATPVCCTSERPRRCYARGRARMYLRDRVSRVPLPTHVIGSQVEILVRAGRRCGSERTIKGRIRETRNHPARERGKDDDDEEEEEEEDTR